MALVLAMQETLMANIQLISLVPILQQFLLDVLGWPLRASLNGPSLQHSFPVLHYLSRLKADRNKASNEI